MNTYHKLYKENDDWLFNLRISSVFPVFNGIYFIPKPRIQLFGENLNLEERDQVKIKKLKKALFIELNLFKKFIANKRLDINNVNIIGSFIMSNTNNTEIKYEKSEIPHNILDRVSNKSEIFYESELEIGNNIDLYYFIDIKEDKINIFNSIFKLLSYNGIGGYRSIGRGQFEDKKEYLVYYDDDVMTLKDINNTLVLNLSLFFPSELDINNIDFESDKTSYSVLKRGGYIEYNTNLSTYKRSIRMFEEGSIFKIKNTILGETVDVTPLNRKDIRVYRYGKIFPLYFTRDI
jgi:CRISPR type III-A-associated RAMP protein Csm4